MTALHWAASDGDVELASLLLYAGANVRATTRLGGYTPMHLASQAGAAAVIKALAAAGADVNARDHDRRHAADAGRARWCSRRYRPAGRAVGRPERDRDGQRTDGSHVRRRARSRRRGRALLQHGADPRRPRAPSTLEGAAPEERCRRRSATRRRRAGGRSRTATGTSAAAARAASRGRGAPAVPGLTRPYTFNELIGSQGGLTALHFAARQGATATVQTLVDGGADINAASPAITRRRC